MADLGDSLPDNRPVKPVTLKIFTSDPTIFFDEKFETGKGTTAGQIKEVVLGRLQLSDSSDVFSVWLISKHLQLQLKPYHCPCKLFKRWAELLGQFTTASFAEIEAGDEPVLILQRNVFLHVEAERELLSRIRRPDGISVDQAKTVINLLYWEARENVIRGRYPMTTDELHMLAGYLAASDIDVSPEAVTFDTLRPHLQSLYPSHMLDRGLVTRVMRLFLSPADRLEDKIVESCKLACQMREGADSFNLKVLYLQLCWSKPFYGSVMFVGQIEPSARLIHRVAYQDHPITVAINPDCIHLFDAGQPRETLLYLTYDQLSWALEPATEEGEHFYSCLWLEFDSVMPTPGGEDLRVAKRIQIFSRQAPMMDAMIDLCVESINTREGTLRRMNKGQDDGPDASDPRYVWKSKDQHQQGTDQHQQGTDQRQQSRDQRQQRGLNCKEDMLSCIVIPHNEPQQMTLESNF